MSTANVTSAVRMAATLVQQNLADEDWAKIAQHPNTLSFIVEAILHNSEQIIVPIPDANPATLLKISAEFGDIGDRYDQEGR